MNILRRLEALTSGSPAYQVAGEVVDERKMNQNSRAEQEKRDKKIAKATESYVIGLLKEKLDIRYKNLIELMTYEEFKQLVVDLITGLKDQRGLPPDVNPDYIEYGTWSGGGSPRSTLALGTDGKNFKVETKDEPHVRVYVKVIPGQPDVIENGPRSRFNHCV